MTSPAPRFDLVPQLAAGCLAAALLAYGVRWLTGDFPHWSVTGQAVIAFTLITRVLVKLWRRRPAVPPPVGGAQ